MPNTTRCLLALVIAWAVVSDPAAADPGAALYAEQCAHCHGQSGEGSKRYKSALVGEQSPAQLAQVIQKTMPDTDPGSLSDDEARQVADYIHREFYSPDAQDRRRPARIELARLTVDQYRLTVSDLIGSFTNSPAEWRGERGLKAEYFAGRGFDTKNRKVERVEPGVRQDFGTGAPEPLDAQAGFSVKWQGGLMPPETGEFEVIVHTDHAVRVWVNDDRKPLIDAWVKSGTDTEFRGTLSLTAGRPVPIRVEFSKAKQGVQDDPHKNKKLPPPKPAFIRLEWKRPGRPAEFLVPRHLSTGNFRPVYTVTTPFPPDDKSLGWIRGTTVSKQFDSAATDAALAASLYFTQSADRYAGTKEDAPDRRERLKKLCVTFAERAFRRPLTDDERKTIVERHFEGDSDVTMAVRRATVLTLVSPRFLYREVVGPSDDSFAVASRLSYALWDSMPDQKLMTLARQGKLKTREQVTNEAERLVRDPKAVVKLTGFVRQWLHTEGVADISKSIERFPGFDAQAASDLKTSLELFVHEVLTSEKADFRELLTSQDVYLNARLAKLYGVKSDSDDFVRLRPDGDRRAGVLTHPYILSAFAYNAETSPIHRGVFLARGILGINLKPPQEAFTPLSVESHPKLNTRERVALQTQGTNCQTCHSIINPLGFTLEEFDAIGRLRATDNDKPIDATGGYLPRTGEPLKFDGAQELARFLVQSEEVHESFARQLFHHLAQQPVRAYGADQTQELRDRFRTLNYDIRKLAVEAASEVALKPRPTAGIARGD